MIMVTEIRRLLGLLIWTLGLAVYGLGMGIVTIGDVITGEIGDEDCDTSGFM